MTSFQKRAVFGALFVAVFVGCLVLGTEATMALFIITGALGLYEILKMMDGTILSKLLGGIIAVVLMTGMFVGGVFALSFEEPRLIEGTYFISFLFLLLIAQLFIKKQFLLKMKMGTHILGSIYAIAPFICLFFIALKYEPIYILGIAMVIWANDTFAYLVGRKIGKTKLFERISPNKTWEGSIGGALIALVFVVLVNPYFFDALDRTEWLIVGIISIVFGAIGDLLESMFKRYYGVKDSGNVIPGHGGILDRFDALMGAAPFVLSYLLLR